MAKSQHLYVNVNGLLCFTFEWQWIDYTPDVFLIEGLQGSDLAAGFILTPIK